MGETYENASDRKSYVGTIFNKGSDLTKKEILDSLPKEWSDLHTKGYIYIHDLNAYGTTYNCLNFSILNKFPFDELNQYNDTLKILEIFGHFRNIIAKMANEQSGGMGFANFDEDISTIFDKLHIEHSEKNMELLSASILSFIRWINGVHERCGLTSYYVTLNLGLSTNTLGQKVTEYVLTSFRMAGPKVFKPNIVFKVKEGINLKKSDPNYYLLELALATTCEKMIPTYVLCDCESNKKYNPKNLSVMGCRTRVVQNIFGEPTGIGRGNIANITINLPRIALDINAAYPSVETEQKISLFLEKWKEIAATAVNILLDRYKKLISMDKIYFPTNMAFDLWTGGFLAAASLEEIFRNGTQALGFIGLSETIEILIGSPYYETTFGTELALKIVREMRAYTNNLINIYNLNFSLLATAGEQISGSLPEKDCKYYDHPVLKKGFYTNSFHVNVDSGLTPFEKIEKEGPFHTLCNGGCISYVEFSSAPISNTEALYELICHGINCGIHYLGFNFPIDVCNKCGEKGIFDICDSCGSKDITRIRRVSGYLEILDYFTSGKKNEVKNRKSNN
ncbi:MAG TPA: anaerobic ribonucleoside-triphosphate reductase [Methanocorpusculum sp.]|nr:anaerobic ribonucleoside-triphosphate reductase [Methanocorpusculum sp.]